MYQYHVEKKLYHFTYTGPTILQCKYIYILQFKRGSENQPINRPLSAGTPFRQTVSPQRVALQKVSPTLPEAWSHWMAFVQLQHPNCPPFSSSKKMQKMQVFKKKTEKWSHSKFTKKFQHHFSLQLDFGHYSLKPKDVGVRRHGEGLWAGHCGVAVEADGTGARSKLASTFAERRRGWPW